MGMMRKAQRRKAKLRLGLSGPAGSGKTLGALLLAYGITGNWGDICLIDSENYSGELYANTTKAGVDIGEYNIISLTVPYTPEKYTAAIRECEDAGIKVIIVDSLTHAWAGEGGLLDKKGQMEKKAGVNSWTAWRDITPMHNRLVESILSSKVHIIATLRAKMEHVSEKNDQGKTVIRKLGINPIQRDGMEYEFTTFVDVDQDHQCTSSKDRTGIVDGKAFQLSPHLGKQFLDWLETGVDAPGPPAPPTPLVQDKPAQDLASFDIAHARRTFFASLGDVVTETGADKDTVEKYGKALVYKAMDVDSLSKLTAEQWYSVIKSMDGLKKSITAAIKKSSVPKEEVTNG